MLRINFLGHMLVVYTVVHFGRIILHLHLIWLELSYNNVYRALMGIKRVYGHSISSEYVNNCIDDFEATPRKLTSSLRGRLYMSSNTIIAPYISSRYFMFASPLLQHGIVTLLFCASLKKCIFSFPRKQLF